MQFVSIPLNVLESPEYLSMTPAEQKFLIDLYAMFHDCQRFTIDMDRPLDYRQQAGADLNRKIRALIGAGMIEVVCTARRKFNQQRVFAFTHPTREILQEAA